MIDPTRGFKAAVFDIETSSLAAIGAGVLLCVVIRPIGMGKIVTLRADEFHCHYGHEVRLLDAVMAELGKYRIWIGHNLINFDWPWLKSRLKYFERPIPQGAFAYDTMQGFKRLGYKTVPNGWGKPSKSLGHVVDFFGIEQEKSAIFPREHWEIVWGNTTERKKAMDKLVDHCYADVRMTETVFHAMIDDDQRAILKRLL